MNDKLFFVMRMRFYCIIVILYREEIMLKCQIHNAKNVKTGFTQAKYESDISLICCNRLIH